MFNFRPQFTFLGYSANRSFLSGCLTGASFAIFPVRSGNSFIFTLRLQKGTSPLYLSLTYFSTFGILSVFINTLVTTKSQACRLPDSLKAIQNVRYCIFTLLQCYAIVMHSKDFKYCISKFEFLFSISTQYKQR